MDEDEREGPVEVARAWGRVWSWPGSDPTWREADG
jgi:hypothetical protein